MYIKQRYSYLKLFISSTIKYSQGYISSLARNEKNGFIEDKRDQSSSWSSFNLQRTDKIILNFQVFIGATPHPTSEMWPLPTFSMNLRHERY